MLRGFAGKESGKGVDSSQTCIARRDTIVTLLFQMRQKLADLLCRKIVEFQTRTYQPFGRCGRSVTKYREK